MRKPQSVTRESLLHSFVGVTRATIIEGAHPQHLFAFFLVLSLQGFPHFFRSLTTYRRGKKKKMEKIKTATKCTRECIPDEKITRPLVSVDHNESRDRKKKGNLQPFFFRDFRTHFRQKVLPLYSRSVARASFGIHRLYNRQPGVTEIQQYRQFS